MSKSGVDPVTIEILWNRLVSIADEQAKALFRGSFSTAVGESEDFASTIHDSRGRMIAQSVSTGTISMLTGLTKSIQAIAEKFDGNLSPGDAIICNDPWMFSGHKYDVTVANPIFQNQQLIGWGVTCLHVADIGGIGFSANSKNAYEEGLHLPPIKLYEAGEPAEALFEIISKNVRMPRQVLGDFQAQVAANEVGGVKLLELMHEYDLADLQRLADIIISRSEQALRDAIQRLPDGSYYHSVQMDGRDEPLTIAATVVIEGDEILVDFDGSSPQVEYGINGVLNVTFGWSAHAIKCALVPDVPNNEGFFRPIRITAPEGTLVNARYPAATAARHVLYMYLSGAVFGALSHVVPERVIADSGIISIPSIQGVNHEGEDFAYWFLMNNGMGATASHDGYSGTSCPASVPSPSIEIVENVSPVFFERVEFEQDSGGPGKFRGGLAQDVEFRVRTPNPVLLSCMFERIESPAQGYLGGQDGKVGHATLNNSPIDPKGRHKMAPGDVLSVSCGGGGGFLPPQERDPEDVLKDIIDGMVSVTSAREIYRVAVNQNGRDLDWEETAHLRKSTV